MGNWNARFGDSGTSRWGIRLQDVDLLSKVKSLRRVTTAVRAWWMSPVDYAAQVGYFERRGLLGAIQLLIGGCGLLVAAIPVVAQFSPSGPDTLLARTASAAFTAIAVVRALAWWCRDWPSRPWSIAFIVFADVGVAVVSALDSNPLAGLVGLNLMVLVSVYAKFFDGPKLLVAHTIWATGWALYLAFQIADGSPADPYLAAAKAMVAIAVLVATPIAVHFGVWVLRGDADAAITDDLTGLLNRRGLHLLLNRLIAQALAGNPTGDATLVVMVIDLDRFKDINDAHGHAIGDEVLVRTGRRIASAMDSPALIARTGGEEFVVAAFMSMRRVTSVAARILDAIAAPADSPTVTASIGVTTVSSAQFTDPHTDRTASLEQAIAHADHAMFTAKRHGGNAMSRYPVPPPPHDIPIPTTTDEHPRAQQGC
ncbi:diguanylate cyclase domain-containing protein [Mycobacterium sp. C31M]